jgi:transposase
MEKGQSTQSMLQEATRMNNSKAYKRAQLPAGALYVGVDPHKRQHTVSVCDEHNQVLARFKIGNSRAGFEELLRRCAQCRAQRPAQSLLFAIEPAGHYWRTLAAFLSAQGYEWRLVNPLTLKRLRDGDDLTHRKNDERDATMAADLLQQGKYTWTRLPEGPYAELRQAHDTYQQLLVEETRLKLQLRTALDQLFPELTGVFKTLDGQTGLTVLRTCPNPAVIAQLTLAEFVAHVERAHAQFGCRRCQQRKVRALHALSAQSIGLRSGAEALSQQVRGLAERLAFTQAQVAQSEQYLLQCLRRCPDSPYLLSLCGLGERTAAGLLAHIGDVCHFSGVKQLTKLAGINPIEDSSADQRAGRTPMSKKGRAGLRMVTWRAVVGLLRHNEFFRSYVQRLQQRTQHPLKKREAIGAAMNKLLRIAYALLSKHEMFDTQKASAA